MAFRALVEEKGLYARLLFLCLVFVQVVVALIPGEPLEIAGGYAFGAVGGTLLCLVGATLGSILVFALVRKFGVKLFEVFDEKIEHMRALKNYFMEKLEII